MLTSSSLPTFFKCLGKLEGRLLRLGLEHSLDGLLHQTRAIGGACCFLLKALFPHPIPSYTALESSFSWGCLLTCPLKNNTLLRIFVGQGWKKLPSFWCSKHRDWETLPASQCWIFKGGSCGGRDLCGEKNFEDWLMSWTHNYCWMHNSRQWLGYRSIVTWAVLVERILSRKSVGKRITELSNWKLWVKFYSCEWGLITTVLLFLPCCFTWQSNCYSLVRFTSVRI